MLDGLFLVVKKEFGKMSNSKEKATKSKAKAKNDNFVWTDDEVELLLNVVIEYKFKRTAENVDWESSLFIRHVFINGRSAESTRWTRFELLRHRFQIVFKFIRIRRPHGDA